MHRKLYLPIVAAVIAAPAPALSAKTPDRPVAESAADRDPDAMAALDRMGAAMRAHPNLYVHADITAEDVLESGQKLQYGGTVDIMARRPNQLKMVLKIDGSERQLYFDGKTLTLFAPGPNFYATADAPPTIRETLTAAADEYGLQIPLADLFTWGEDASSSQYVTSAFKAGEEPVGDQVCDHYAVRQPFVDWQIWIRQGEEALPCKLVITNTDDPAMPQVTAVYTWLPTPAPVADAFTFRAPESAHQIAFKPLKAATAIKTGKSK